MGSGWTSRLTLARLATTLGLLLALFGGTIHAQSSRPPLRYGIVATSTGNYPKISAMGFGWVKIFVNWSSIEPSLNSYNSGGYPDNAVNQAHANNLHVLMLVFGTPSWASGSNSTDLSIPPTYGHVGDFGSFMGHLASHYQGEVDAYEIWNEENVWDTWGGENPDPTLFTNMLKAAYPAVKGADSNALVISGGVANDGAGSPPRAIGDLVYLQEILQQGAANYVDAIGIHPYPGACSPESTSCAATPGTYFQRAVEEHNTVVTYGGGGLPIWITEAGYFSQPGNLDPNAASCNGSNGLGGFVNYEVDETSKANWLVDAYGHAYNNWPWLGMFMMMNLDLDQGSYATCDPVRFWSILTASGGTTPAYTALQNMTKYTAGLAINAPPNGSYDESTGKVTVTGHVFDTATGVTPAIDQTTVAIDSPSNVVSAPVVVNADGTFQVTVDVSTLSAYVTHVVYLSFHSPSDGWLIGSTGIYVQPLASVQPNPILVLINKRTAAATSSLLSTVGRNDNSSQAYGWSVISNTSWIGVAKSPINPMGLIVTVDGQSLPMGNSTGTITISGDSGSSSYFKDLPLTVTVSVTAGDFFQVYLPFVHR